MAVPLGVAGRGRSCDPGRALLDVGRRLVPTRRRCGDLRRLDGDGPHRGVAEPRRAGSRRRRHRRDLEPCCGRRERRSDADDR